MTEPSITSSPSIADDVETKSTITPSEWTPLAKVARGVAICRYSPMTVDSTQSITGNLEVGDEAFVFELHSTGNWYRGYIVTSPRAQSAFNRPLPKNNKLNSGSVRPLDPNVSVGVFPCKAISIKEYFDVGNEKANNNNSNSNEKTSRFSSLLAKNSDLEVDSIHANSNINKLAPPPIPALRLGTETPTMPSEPLVDDITSVIKEWYNTYIYFHFLNGNYALVKSIHEIIKDLYDIRRKLVYGLLTFNERVIARKKAVWQISRVTKMLRHGVVVREPTTGEIISGKDGPVKLAQEQMLLALAPNYPDHAVVGDIVKEATLPKHILVDFKSCIGQAYGNGLSVDLYLRTKTHRLTESYTIKIDTSISITQISAVLFRDLPISVTKDDVFLVAKLYEEIPIKSHNTTNTAQLMGGVIPKSTAPPTESNVTIARKGIAAGAADISRLFRMEESVESPITLRMFATYFNRAEPNDENRGWGELVDRIVRGRPRGVATTTRAEQVVCFVKEFEGPTVNNIQQLANEDAHRPVGFAKSLFVNSLSESRNDTYIHMGKVSLSHAIGRLMEQITLTLSSSSGNALFSSSSNHAAQKSWMSNIVVNNEAIGEMVGTSNFEKNEVLYMNLYVGGQFLGQGSIPIWHGNRVWSGKRLINFVRDGINVASLQTVVDFVGNGYNTDISIEKILNWKLVYEKNGIDELSTTLAKLKVVEDTEFLKRFHDVLDCLFDMFADFMATESEEFLAQIFYALIYTLEKVTARSKEHVYLGEDYLNTKFNFAGMAKTLLHLTERCLLNADTLGHQLLINLFKVSEYLSRLVATSAAIDSDRGKESQMAVSMVIRNYMQRITAAAKTILCRPEKTLIDLQMVMVQNIYQWFHNLRRYVPTDEIAQHIIETIDSMRIDHDKINTHRLLIIKKLSTSWLYKQSKYRPHITAYTIKWTIQLWVDTKDFSPGRKEQLRLLSGIYASQFKTLWPVRHQEPEVCKRYGQLLPLGAKLYTELLTHFENSRKYPCTVFSPLFPDSYPFETRAIDSAVTDAVFDETLIELGIVFTLLVNIAHFSGQHMPDRNLSENQVSELASNIIRACTAMMNCVSFPRTWVSLLAVHHETVLGCLDYLSSLMKSRFIPSPEDAEKFDSDLWYSFLTCILQLIGSEAIAVEHLPEQKRMAIWKIARDIRGRAVMLLRDVWDAIGWPAVEEDKARFGLDVFGGFQVQMFGGETSLVREILNLCLIRHPTTQQAAVHILQTMIVSEWALNEDLTGLQREIVASLDDTFQNRMYLPESHEKKSFDQYLRGTFNVDREDEAFPYISRLLDAVEEFLDLLLDLYNIPSGDAFNDDRIFHALNVLNFLKDIDRVEIFSRYVNDIALWNRNKLNYTQAGLALKLLASAYEWSLDIKLGASESPKFPVQSSFRRKEALYEEIIQNFTRGKAFENAIDATKELIMAYETVSFDFKKLASATRILAKLYDSIDNIDRVSASYFRVAYIGVGFPRSLRNRQFIFEGTPWEKLESIHERLHRLYPGATIVSNETQAKLDGQYLYVSTVVPERDTTRDYFSRRQLQSISPGAKEFQSRSNMKYFSYSRPLSGTNSPLDLWVEKVVYETYQSFPTIVKRSEVKQVSMVKLSPVENALNLLNQKINDLLDLELLFNVGKADQGTVTKLDLILSGSVDSPVNGGIPIYRAFLDDQSLRENPNTSQKVLALELAFLDYAAALQRCLVIHGKVVPATLKPLHDNLMQLFQRNYERELNFLMSVGSYEEVRQSIISRQASFTNLSNRGRSSSLSKSSVHSTSNGQTILYDYSLGNNKSGALENLLGESLSPSTTNNSTYANANGSHNGNGNGSARRKESISSTNSLSAITNNDGSVHKETNGRQVRLHGI